MWRRVDDREEGYVAFWVVIIAAVVLTGGGLVYDITDKAAADRRATMLAGEAGRAAAQELSADVIGGGPSYSLDTTDAAAAARDYLAAAGVEGTVTVEGTRVLVTTRVPWEPSMMPLPADTLTGTATINAEEVTP